MTDYLIKNATISKCGLYRYQLLRVWDPSLARVLFVMLNPSTASGVSDDATIRTCVRLAKEWGYGGIEVGNLFALRATSPKELGRPGKYPEGIVGPVNDLWLDVMAFSLRHLRGTIVAAWGANVEKKRFASRAVEVTQILLKRAPVHHLGLTAGGSPRHPLYLPKGTKPQLWKV